jgi:hypothetical protein
LLASDRLCPKLDSTAGFLDPGSNKTVPKNLENVIQQLLDRNAAVTNEPRSSKEKRVLQHCFSHLLWIAGTSSNLVCHQADSCDDASLLIKVVILIVPDRSPLSPASSSPMVDLFPSLCVFILSLVYLFLKLPLELLEQSVLTRRIVGDKVWPW